MSGFVHDPIVRRLNEAEGYLMLDMPSRALDILQEKAHWAPLQFEASFLSGEAHRQLGRYREALVDLERAAALRPTHFGVAVALGWCYKRTHRLAQAIDALERARTETPEEPLLHYNLACYWSLAGNPQKALECLSLALELDPELHSRIETEPDLDNLRAHPDFKRVLLRKATSL